MKTLVDCCALVRKEFPSIDDVLFEYVESILETSGDDFENEDDIYIGDNPEDNVIKNLKNIQTKQKVVNRFKTIARRAKKEREEKEKTKEEKKNRILFGGKIVGVIIGAVVSFLFL